MRVRSLGSDWIGFCFAIEELMLRRFGERVRWCWDGSWGWDGAPHVLASSHILVPGPQDALHDHERDGVRIRP